MLANVATFMTAKRGISISDCEDAWSISPEIGDEGDFDGSSLRIVVSDGASESLLAGRWARCLSTTVAQYPSSPVRTGSTFEAAYNAAVSRWALDMETYSEERADRNAPVQWYEDEGLRKGSHATLLAVEFFDDRDRLELRWRAAAVGDSCVFQVRDERIEACFPLGEANEFTHNPPLLASRGSDRAALRRSITVSRGTCHHEDRFYIATDALAAWFLRAVEVGGRPWEPLRDLGTSEFSFAFGDWVNDLRDAGELANDDTTLVRVDIF